MKRKRESVLEEQEVEKKLKVDENHEPNGDEIFNFDVKLFRKKLKKESNNFFDDLKFFVNNAEKSPQLISDFLELGGRPLEVVEAISRNEQNNDVLSNLFQMLQYVSSKIITDEQKGDSILQGLKFLVTKHSNTITKMLSSTKPSDKKVALNILAICVSTNRELGVDILKNIEVFTKTKNKEDLSEIFKVTKQQEQIRAAFVEFIISFLYNDADAVLRKRLLQNRILFELLLQDLHKDNSQIIERVLSVITEKILMSSDFSRLEKFKTFSSEVVKSLLKLYDWRGNESEKEHIQTISHYFLKLLLTNKKYGIVFKPFAEKVKNLRQLDVITTFKNVWMLEYPSNLVIEIVKACPDLIQPILDRLVMALRPKETTSWLMCVNFTKNLITAFDPKVMINFFTLLPAKKVSNNIIKLSVSELILENTKDNALIQLDKLEIREAVVSLLHLMLDRCCKFLDEIKTLKNLKDFEQHRIKFDIINHIFTFFPNIDMILNSLYRSINLSVRKKSDENEALVKSQLKHTLEILLLLIERFPSIIEKIPSVVDYLEVLRPIYEYQLNSTNIEDNSGLEIEMKVVKIILLLQPNILSSDAAMFNKIFSIMIQVYSCSKNENYRKEAKLLTSKMLHSTQIFSSNNPIEISIWIEALRFIKPNLLKETANKFIELIKSIKKSDDMHEKLEIKRLNQNLLKMIDNFEESEEVVNSQLSSVLTTLLRMESGKLNKIIDFVEISFILFYHTYPDLKKSFKSLLATKSSEHSERFLAYINADELSNFQDILPTTPEFIYRKFQQSVITGEKFNMKDINEDEHQFLLLQSIFCSIKLSENYNLTDDKIELLINNIRKFYKNLKSQEEEKPISSEQVETSDKKVVNKIFLMTNEYSTLEVIMSHIFNSQSRLFKKFNVNDESSQITKFVVKLVEVFNTNDNLKKSLLKYRQKVITQLKESNEANDTIVMNILEEFPFSDLEYIELMNTVLKNQKSLTQLRKIMILLKKISQKKTTALLSTQIHEIENSYINAIKNPSFEFSAEFCDIFYDYLSTFIHNIADTTNALFELALLDELTVNRSFIKLLIMLFMHNDVNNDFFIANVLNLKKEILYPILHIAFRKELIVNKMMTTLYQTFKSGILRTIEKPNRAAQIYRENIKSTIQLIEKGMPINECRDLSMKKFKFDSTEVYQLEILSAIFMKAFEKENDKSTVVFFNFFNNWLQMFGLAEKRMYDDFGKILSKWFDIAPAEINCEKLDEKNWEYFYTTCLKLGLKSVENSYMLILLGKSIRILDIDTNQIATIFDMIVTHSNFCGLVFNMKSSQNKWKRDLFYLLNILVQRNPLIAHKKHIPIYLSSYQATMSSCDQLILNLLRFYELNSDIDFYEFRPFLFGSTALTHFSSLNQNELKISANSLDEVKKSYFKVINSFEKTIITNTIVNFPIKRKLVDYGLHELDQLLTKNNENEENSSDQIYDPVFFLPLFEVFLSLNNFNFISLATKKNLLGLLPLGLSFEDLNMRLMTARILMKCRESIEGNKKKKELWIEFYEGIQKGLSKLKKIIPKGHKSGDKIEFPRVAPVSSQLLSEFFNVIPNKLHCVHSILANYVIVREIFDFATIPEFMILMCSYELNQEEHRLFLLNTINDGIRDELDFKLLNNTPIIKMLLSCFGTTISSRKIDLLILKIIDNLIVKAKATEFLTDRYGLLLWMYQVCINIEAFEYDSIDMIISIIDHLKEIFSNDAEKSKLIMSALVSLLEKFTKTKLSPKTFLKFISIVNQIQNFIPTIGSKHYELILEMVDIFITIEIKQHLNYINRYPDALKIANLEELFVETVVGFDENTKEMINQCKQFIKSFHLKKH